MHRPETTQKKKEKTWLLWLLLFTLKAGIAVFWWWGPCWDLSACIWWPGSQWRQKARRKGWQDTHLWSNYSVTTEEEIIMISEKDNWVNADNPFHIIISWCQVIITCRAKQKKLVECNAWLISDSSVSRLKFEYTIKVNSFWNSYSKWWNFESWLKMKVSAFN